MTTMIEQLKQPLDKTLVKKRKQGRDMVNYLESWVVIDQANKIFDFRWDFQIDNLSVVWVGEIESNDKTRQEVHYTCRGTVTVYLPDPDNDYKSSVYKSDVGYGNGMDYKGNVGSCHELASKEAVSDCLKRCFRQLGNQFGNSVYDKEENWKRATTKQDGKVEGTDSPAKPASINYKAMFGDALQKSAKKQGVTLGKDNTAEVVATICKVKGFKPTMKVDDINWKVLAKDMST